MVQVRENEHHDQQLSPGGGSESLSDESPRLSEYMVKPINPPKPVSKKLPSGSSAKRPIDNESKPESKKIKTHKLSTLPGDDGKNKNGSGEGKVDEAKKSPGEGKEEEVKKPYDPLWSEEDEINLLKAIEEYKSKYNSLPPPMGYAFYKFTRKSVDMEFTQTQLYAKIRRLKTEYDTVAEKSRKDSSIKLSPRQNRLLHLGDKIWGKDETNEANDDTVPLTANNTQISTKKSGVKVGKTKVDAKTKKQLEEHAVVKEDVETGKKRTPEEFWACYPYLSKSLEVMKQSSNELTAFVERFWLEKRTEYEYGNDKAKEIDEKWMKLEMEEMELNVKKVGLIQEHAKVALDAMKKLKRMT